MLLITCSCEATLRKTSTILNVIKRLASTQPPQPVFIEKALEHPVIILKEEDDVDIMGPPDPLSNLRPVVRKILKNETTLQRKFRQAADETHEWNHEFWAKHNNNFIKEKTDYIRVNTTEGKPQLNADEMSEFYKDFLNKNWERHVRYNFEWYRRNFTLLMLALRVSIEKSQLKYF